MKKALKIIAIILFAGFVVLQFFRPERLNPPIVQAETIESNVEVSPEVGKIFERSCNDCHSNKTIFPWYSNVAPVSWQVVDHINEGRQKLNFSIWSSYDLKKQDGKLKQICNQVTDGEMPMYQYVWVHWNAKLTAEDVKTLCDWTGKQREILKPKLEPQN